MKLSTIYHLSKTWIDHKAGTARVLNGYRESTVRLTRLCDPKLYEGPLMNLGSLKQREG